MSSSPRADSPAGRSRIRSPRTWSLRARLLVTQIAVLAVVCAGIGIATEFALQRFLMHQLDEQVNEAGRRSAMIFEMPPLPPFPGPRGYPRRERLEPELGPGPGFLDAPGQSTRTVGAVIVARRAGRCGRHHRRRDPRRDQCRRRRTIGGHSTESQPDHRRPRRAGQLPGDRHPSTRWRRDDRDWAAVVRCRGHVALGDRLCSASSL